MSTPHRPDHGSDPAHLPPAGPTHAEPKKAYVADDEALARVQASEEFQELKKRFRNFAFPLSAAFLIWYFAYVLLSTYAVDFMRKEVIGHVTIGLLLGLLQFVTTFGITWLYIRHANKNLDPIASRLRAELEAQ
ncbi:DUF485 domain-containing protein [Luteococcus peritonei]|uniref:DUF485 domain-containing protein n=1 Tax=Luteococcus peritonei TaxID=88874 RepID=A0ABW4RWK8_9ACTN